MKTTPIKLPTCPLLCFLLLTFLLHSPPFAIAQYQVKSNYLQNPELVLDYVKDCADFWLQTRDNTHGGYLMYVDRTGKNVIASGKSLQTHSRLAFGLSRAFMLTGDTTYLSHAEHALEFLYGHGWDPTHGGWFFNADEEGNIPDESLNREKWSFTQYYALTGPIAYFEATRDPMALQQIERTVKLIDQRLWDNRPGVEGYFERTAIDWSDPSGKGFTPTVDAIGTYALGVHLLELDLNTETRLNHLFQHTLDYIYASRNTPGLQLGFVSFFDNDWQVNTTGASGFLGHIFKTSWALGRAYMLDPQEEYVTAGRELLYDMWENGGYDRTYGGPYLTFDWQKGEIRSDRKQGWVLEQGITSGLIHYYLSQDPAEKDVFLQIADESLDFFMTHLYDTEYGEVYSQAFRDGSGISDSTKGSIWKGGYHSIETGYYTYLYGNLLYHNNSARLFYQIPSSDQEQVITLSPFAILDGRLEIKSVKRDGAPYFEFDSQNCQLQIAAGVSGIFEVEFGVNNTPTSITLPVNWEAVNAKVVDKNVKISWTTSLEVNNAYFEVERSQDLNHFTSIGQVAGRNNGNLSQNYVYWDSLSLVGPVYYRIKQVDWDGTYQFSKTVSITHENSLLSSIIGSYPNPVQDTWNLYFNSSKSGTLLLKLKTLSGREILTQTQQILPGKNQWSIDMTSFSPGIYLYLFSLEGTTRQGKLIVN